MKRITIIFVLFIFTFSAFSQQASNKLTNKEVKQGWVLLFDGVSSNGWVKANGAPFPSQGWVIENGVLTVHGKGGDIITDKEFTDFELSIDFKITKGANSGIKYFVLPKSSLGCEFQILDDATHPDAKMGISGNRLQGALYDLIPPSPKKRDKPVGEWNNAKIISKGKHVEHWLNGKKIVSYERGSDEFNSLVAGSKYKNEKGFATPLQTPILLQDHGDEVSFRNIKIRSL